MHAQLPMEEKRRVATDVIDNSGDEVHSPLTNINRACQQCHHYPEQEILKRVETIQDRHYALLTRTGNALVDMLDAIKAAKQASATEAQLAPILQLQRQAQLAATSLKVTLAQAAPTGAR
jgi:formate-dependent nitrite reductase cytochrome c552 subunit